MVHDAGRFQGNMVYTVATRIIEKQFLYCVHTSACAYNKLAVVYTNHTV